MREQWVECPVCKSDHIVTNETERYENAMIAEVECEECFVKWFEVYTFDHNENEMGDIL